MSLDAALARAQRVMASRLVSNPDLHSVSAYAPAGSNRVIVSGSILRHECHPVTGADFGVCPRQISLGDFHRKWLDRFPDRLAVVSEDRFGTRYSIDGRPTSPQPGPAPFSGRERGR